MSKTVQGILIALAVVFVLTTGFSTVLLSRQAFAPAQPVAQPVTLPATTNEDQTPANTIQVTAQGTVRVEPDIACITLGVQSEAKTAESAQAANLEKMTGLYQALEKMGIEKKDYYTSQYNVSPVYSYADNTPRVTGYTTVNTVEVTVRDLDKIGALLDEAAKAGMNQAYSLQFDLENPDAAGLEAMKAALTNADAKAKLMAQTTGAQIVRVISVRDSGVNTSSPNNNYRYAAPMAEAAAMDKASVPVSSGTLEVTVQASITYEIK